MTTLFQLSKGIKDRGGIWHHISVEVATRYPYRASEGAWYFKPVVPTGYWIHATFLNDSAWITDGWILCPLWQKRRVHIGRFAAYKHETDWCRLANEEMRMASLANLQSILKDYVQHENGTD
jgi:hypothetical protein